jgi:hypothetical protein
LCSRAINNNIDNFAKKHKGIAFHFGMWISPRFQLLLAKEFQRLKEDEQNTKSLGWNLQRTFFKINYRIHNDVPQGERLVQFNSTVITQMRWLAIAIPKSCNNSNGKQCR